jgi:hypothetical protein
VTDLSALQAKRAAPETPASIDLADASGAAIGSVSPGGSLSIADAGVTIGFWSIHDDGVVLTSDTFWSPSTQQRVIWPWAGSPKVDTNNVYFQTVAQYAGDGRWTIDLSHGDNRIRRVAMIVRTEAKAAPATRRILLADGRVLVDDRWEVRIAPSPVAARAGEEVSRGRFVSQGDNLATADNGAAFALLELGHSDQTWKIEIADLQRTPTGGTTAP